MGLCIVILAAGKGKRMMTDMPKVLHTVGGIPLLEHVVKTAKSLNPDAIHVIYGNGGVFVTDKLHHLLVHWIEQEQQLGTGHAVLQALPECQDHDQVLVLYGDVPLISARTLRQLLQETPPNGLGLIIAELDDPTGFGRIIRNEMGNIISIVEHKDASVQQRSIHEINTGILTTSARHLKNWLPRLKNKNKQREYYLTDIVALAVKDGYPVGGVLAHCQEEIQGVNDLWQLACLERYYQQMQAKRLTYSGVTIRDPSRLFVRGHTNIESDVILDVNVILEGDVSIGKNSYVGPHVILRDVEIGENVEILANSIVEGAKIAEGCSIGPFARIRPGTIIEKKAKVGNFVEIKKTVLGENSKANHLTYLGDAVIGKEVNIGAGTITCNYDGLQKWPTCIGDKAFIGSNTSLVAPITIGDAATIGAGSTITQDAPKNQLTLGRARQCSIEGWNAPKKHRTKKTHPSKCKHHANTANISTGRTSRRK